MNADAKREEAFLNASAQMELVSFKLDIRRYALPLHAVERCLMRDPAVISKAPH